MGPLEMIAIQFEGNRFTGEIMPELWKLINAGDIRLVDLTFVRKHEGSNFEVMELSDLDEKEALSLDKYADDLQGLLTREDIDMISNVLPDHSSVAVMLFEHAWTEGFADAVRRANGEVIAREVITRGAIEELNEELERAASAGE